MIKAVIFDCFGVVMGDALSVLCSELRKTDPSGDARVWVLIDKANKGEISSDVASTEIAGMFGMSLAEYRAKLQEGEIKDPDLLEYILTLRANYKTAMLSNIPKDSLQRRFTAEELNKYFDTVVASGEVGYAKPEPQVYQIAAEKLGVAMQECVFTDDRQGYCEGAVAAGMHAILYQNFTQFRTDLEALLSSLPSP